MHILKTTALLPLLLTAALVSTFVACRHSENGQLEKPKIENRREKSTTLATGLFPPPKHHDVTVTVDNLLRNQEVVIPIELEFRAASGKTAHTVSSKVYEGMPVIESFTQKQLLKSDKQVPVSDQGLVQVLLNIEEIDSYDTEFCPLNVVIQRARKDRAGQKVVSLGALMSSSVNPCGPDSDTGLVPEPISGPLPHPGVQPLMHNDGVTTIFDFNE